MANNRYLLMLEGDEHDVELSKNYFKTHDVAHEYLKLSTEVLPFLKDKNNSLPAIILLAMNSIPQTGLDVLKEIKADQNLKHLPVIILGESTQDDLINECYRQGASTFFNKPFSSSLTDLTIRTFIQYWFEAAQLPASEKIFSNTKA